MTADLLGEADLRFINLVACRRFGGGEPAEPTGLAAALATVPDGTPQRRAAGLAHALLSGRVFGQQGLSTALLAMTCQLERDGLQLLAPQGAIAGMIRELATGLIDAAAMSRWLDDRAVSG